MSRTTIPFHEPFCALKLTVDSLRRKGMSITKKSSTLAPRISIIPALISARVYRFHRTGRSRSRVTSSKVGLQHGRRCDEEAFVEHTEGERERESVG